MGSFIGERMFLPAIIIITSVFISSCNNSNKIKSAEDFAEPVYGPIDTSIKQNFPPIADIIAKPANDLSLYGLFSWKWDYHKTYSDNIRIQNVKNVGWKRIRIGCSYNEMLDDEQMKTIAEFCNETGAEILFSLLSHERQYFVNGKYNKTLQNPDFENLTDDQAFIDNFITFFDSMVAKFGPGGTFFTANPAVPYKPILYWEILNEPNLHYMTGAENWKGLDTEGKADLYARLLMQAYAHARSNPAWNSIKIVAMAGCRGGEKSWNPKCFVQIVHEKIVEHGGNFSTNNYYDVISDHPYVHDCPPDTEHVIKKGGYSYSVANSHAEIRKVMADYGQQTKPVIFSEIGWPRFSGEYPAKEYSVTERTQAAYVVRLYLLSIRLGVEAVDVMFISDADNFNGGFFSIDGSKWYQQAHAVKNLAGIMPNPRITGVISDGDNGYYAYTFKSDVKNTSSPVVTVVWKVNNHVNVTIPCAAGIYTITDMTGSVIEVTNTGSGITVEAGPCPVYISLKL